MVDAGTSDSALIGFAHVREPFLQLLIQHWLAVRSGQLVPRRGDIDPLRLGSALPYVWICDYVPETQRFRMRLSGEENNRLYGRNIAGRDFEDFIAGESLAVVTRRYRTVISRPAILHCAGAIYTDSGKSVIGERIALPLGDGEDRIVHVIGGCCYRWPAAGDCGPFDRETATETFTPLP